MSSAPASSAFDPAAIAERIMAGDRRALARAITLIESTRDEHRRTADALLTRLLPATGKSVRLGISGVPGVGKSTFIERFGLHVISAGHQVAVLAVDPSSRRSGGSILGDKTRMPDLSRHEKAYIRPSPAGITLGGVARRTREAMLVCEAAGFDVIVIETVGVGQSETAVADMVDMFLLLLLPGGGDDLQGIKRGIVELADLIVVNKADGDLKPVARRTVTDYRHALHLLRPQSKNWTVEVTACSALEGQGVDAVWDIIGNYREKVGAAGEIDTRRAEQARAWMWSEISETLMMQLRRHPEVRARVAEAERAVTAGEMTAAAGARQLLDAFLSREMA